MKESSQRALGRRAFGGSFDHSAGGRRRPFQVVGRGHLQVRPDGARGHPLTLGR